MCSAGVPVATGHFGSWLNLNSSVLLAQLGNIFQNLPSSAGRILKNIGPAARAIQKIYYINIGQPGRTILDLSFLEIDDVLRLESGHTVKYSLSPWKITWARPSGFSLGIF